MGQKYLNDRVVVIINSVIMPKCPSWLDMQEMFIFQIESDFLVTEESLEAYCPPSLQARNSPGLKEQARAVTGHSQSGHRLLTFASCVLFLSQKPLVCFGGCIVLRDHVMFVHLIC